MALPERSLPRRLAGLRCAHGLSRNPNPSRFGRIDNRTTRCQQRRPRAIAACDRSRPVERPLPSPTSRLQNKPNPRDACQGSTHADYSSEASWEMEFFSTQSLTSALSIVSQSEPDLRLSSDPSMHSIISPLCAVVSTALTSAWLTAAAPLPASATAANAVSATDGTNGEVLETAALLASLPDQAQHFTIKPDLGTAPAAVADAVTSLLNRSSDPGTAVAAAADAVTALADATTAAVTAAAAAAAAATAAAAKVATKPMPSLLSIMEQVGQSRQLHLGSVKKAEWGLMGIITDGIPVPGP